MEVLDAREFRTRIRYDSFTKKGSVYDVIQLIMQNDKKRAQETWMNIAERFPDIKGHVSTYKFPGQGQRCTPVASLPTLFRIMAVAPGKRARSFNQATMDVFTRAFGGDEELGHEIKRRKTLLQGTPFEDAAKGVSTTVEDALATLDQPLEPQVDHGLLYIATSPLLPFFKVGYWTGSVEKLRSRYVTCYGPQLELQTWECSQCRASETFMLEELAAHSMGGELFDKKCMSDATALLDVASEM